MRSELTPTQMAEHLAKRKELWAARILGGTNCSTKKPQHEKKFAQETAEATGSTRQQINRAVSRAEGVTQEARDAIRGTEHDKGVVLDELRALPPQEQSERASAIVRGDVNRNKIDMDVKARAAKEVAEIISENVPAELWDGLKANLYAAGAKNIANEFSNKIGRAHV